MASVFQLLSFAVDYAMPLEEAVHQPRIDVSGEAALLMDERLPDTVRDALAVGREVRSVPNTVYPVLFA